jgi:nucleoside-diphosphate-sugar epimerase
LPLPFFDQYENSTHWCQFICRQPFNTNPFISRSPGHRHLSKSKLENRSLSTLPKVELVQIDLAVDSDFRKVARDFDAVINNAGSFQWVDVDVPNVVSCNVLSTLNLANYTRRFETVSRIVTFSTLSVYGNVSDRILYESTPTNSPEIYGTSKLATEHIMNQVSEYKNHLIIRFPIVLGNSAHRAFIPRMVGNFIEDKPVEILNPNKLYNSMTTMKAVAKFTNHYLNSESKNLHTVNIGAEKTL